jgi:tetratricopeptide (TPR) repeat protein
MGVVDRIRRQQMLREAEGYLDLVYLFGDRWEPAPPVRDALAMRALALLERLPAGAARGAPALYLKGVALRVLQRYTEALAPLETAAAAEPGNLHIHLCLGWCYKRTAQLDRAIETLEAALEANPNEAILPYNLACYLSLAGRRDDAIAYLSQALAMDEHYRSLLEREPDFDPIRSDPQFQALLSVIV